jgi:hypothetical protein
MIAECCTAVCWASLCFAVLLLCCEGKGQTQQLNIIDVGHRMDCVEPIEPTERAKYGSSKSRVKD